MGYKIEYDSQIGKYEVKKNTSGYQFAIFAAGIAAVLFFAWSFWPEGKEFLREVLIPGEETVTVQALSDLTQGLKNGVSWKEAVTTFCNDVIHGAALTN